MNYNFDMQQTQGLLIQIGLMVFAKVNEAMGNVSLHDVSLSVSILVGMDVLLGSPIKGAFKKLWEKLKTW